MMAEVPLVSVIVPVYNVSEYLLECIQSIAAQTYHNIEIILVDDGSTDGSGLICDELACRDSRIASLHKENGGLSDARNYGLSHCHGEWVSFVDSDDWVSPVFIEALLQAAVKTNCSISAIPSGKQFEDGKSCELVGDLMDVPPVKVLESEDAQRLMLYQRLDTAAQWRLYRRGILGVSPFPKGLYYEDLASVYKIIHKVDRVAVLDCSSLYAYRLRKNGIIRQDYRHIKATSALSVSDQLYENISSWYPELADAAASRCFSVCRMVFAQVPMGALATEEEQQDRFDLWDVLVRYRKRVLRDSQARKRERLAAAIVCLGMGPFSLFCAACRKVGLLR